MSSQDDRKRMEELKAALHYHNYRYYVLNDPVVSDYEYDKMLAELQQLEGEHPNWVTSDSPTQRAGTSPAEGFEKVNHPVPILSLANVYDADGARAWLERIAKHDDRVMLADFVVEPKLDGLTVVLHYRNGVFVQGATRGNGEVGEDVTHNLRTIRSLPLRIPTIPGGPLPPEYLVVRGEVFINLADFEALNERLAAAGEKTYLNARNTAAGSLRQLDPTLTASRPLTLLTYAIVTSGDIAPTTQWETLRTLESYGFPVLKAERCTDLETAIQVVERWTQNRAGLPYEVDGMVIKINDLSLSESLGVVGKDPRGAIAFKFPAQEVTTRLLNIGVNVGRTGVLTPYAVLEPVEIGGVIVRKATLHNFDYIEEKDIRIGDRVRLKRAGDVIPYVIGPVTAAREGQETVYQPPKTCPSCGHPIRRSEDEVAWYCTNPNCPGRIIRVIEYFVSRGAMDIAGLGGKIVEQLVQENLIQDVADLYSLRREDLLNLEGFAEKKVDNLLEAIETSKNQPLDRLITALGIEGVGSVVAGDLARAYRSLDRLSLATEDDLLALEGIGPNIADAIISWFQGEANRRILEKLKAAGVWPIIIDASKEKGINRPLSGMSFVITGTVEGFTRQGLKSYIESHGGKVTGSVSRKTDFVVVGENPGSKKTKAETLRVFIIDIKALQDLIEQGGQSSS